MLGDPRGGSKVCEPLDADPASPGRGQKSRNGSFNRRQLSMTERIAATFGPPVCKLGDTSRNGNLCTFEDNRSTFLVSSSIRLTTMITAVTASVPAASTNGKVAAQSSPVLARTTDWIALLTQGCSVRRPANFKAE
jgi:hypothetical protein